MGCGNDPAAIFGAGEALGKRPGIQDTPNPLIFHHNGRRRYAGTPDAPQLHRRLHNPGHRTDRSPMNDGNQRTQRTQRIGATQPQ